MFDDIDVTNFQPTKENAQRIIDLFKRKAREFSAAYNAIQDYDIESRHPLYSEYNLLLSSGNKIKTTITNITTGIDRLANWILSTFGMGNVTNALQGIDWNFATIATAISPVAAGIVAMTDYVNKIASFNRRASLIQSLMSKGMTADQAVSTANKQEAQAQASGNLASSLSSSIKWAVVGIAIIYLAPKILDMLPRGKR